MRHNMGHERAVANHGAPRNITPRVKRAYWNVQAIYRSVSVLWALWSYKGMIRLVCFALLLPAIMLPRIFDSEWNIS